MKKDGWHISIYACIWGGVYTLQVMFGFNWRSNAFFHGGAGSVPMSSLGEPGLLNPVEPINGVSISFHFQGCLHLLGVLFCVGKNLDRFAVQCRPPILVRILSFVIFFDFLFIHLSQSHHLDHEFDMFIWVDLRFFYDFFLKFNIFFFHFVLQHWLFQN